MRNWLIGIVCAAMVLALAEALVPEGGIRKICRLAGGLVLLLAAVNPVLQMDEGALSRALTEYRVATQDYSGALVEKNNSLYKTIIEENTAAYILDKAEALGVFCQVEVSFGYDEEGSPYPSQVRIWGAWTEEQRSRLSEFLEAELGLSPECQSFERIRT